MTFNGFISYSHAADGRLAPAVQRGLHRLAKPWHRRRALWIFRDQTGLSVTPALWSSIRTAMDGSDYFVLLASPEAAQSQWVNREIAHWIATKAADQILPVVTDGEWAWDHEKRDFTEDSTAVPAALRGVFAEEPLFLDLRWARGSEHLSLQHSRFRDAIAQLAAPMHGVSKDDLEGEDVRQYRRARRLRSGAVAMLTVLALLATLTGVSAVHNAQRASKAAAEALRQQKVAEEQRGSAERSAEEALRQQELAKQQKARAVDAATEASRSEQVARQQQELADRASAEARRQQQLADQAGTRTRQQQRRATEASERARREEAKAKQLTAVAEKQRRLARQAAAEAQRQQAKADRQQAIAVSRRLMNQARSTVGADPRTALMLGAAAQRVRPDTETRSDLSGLVTSTNYAGTIDDATVAEYGPDGVLATLGKDGTVSLWNVADRTRPVRISALPDRAAADGRATFSPDGRTLAVIGPEHHTTLLWDVADRHHPARPVVLPNDGWVSAVAFSGDGVTVATGDDSGITTVWDLTDRRSPRQLAALDEWAPYPVVDIVISHDGRTMVVNKGRFDPIYDLTDPADPSFLRNLDGGFSVASMAFNSTDSTLATGGFDGAVSLYDLTPGADHPAVRMQIEPPTMPTFDDDDGESFARLTGLTGGVGSVAFSRDGRLLAAGDGTGTTVEWNMTPGWGARAVTGMVAHGRVTGLTFDPVTRTLVTTDSSAEATLWNVAPRGAPDPLAAVTLPGGSIEAAAFGPDGRAVLAAGSDGTVRSWDVTDPARPGPGRGRPIHDGRVRAVAISPDSRTVAAVGFDDGTLTLTDRSRAGRPVAVAALPADAPRVTTMAFSPDGRTLVVAAGTSRLLLWDVAARTRAVLLADVGAGAESVTAVAVSPDGRTVAAGAGRTVTLWDVARRSTPVPLGTLAGHSDSVQAVAFSPDGRTLASGSRDQSAMLWDVTDRTRPYRLASLPGGISAVTSAGFSPDGHILALGGGDGGLSLWDTANPAGPVPIATVRAGLEGSTGAVTFGRDRHTLAVASQSDRDSATVTLWDYTKLNSVRADPAKYACAAAGRGLSTAEWARYVPELPYRRTCTG